MKEKCPSCEGMKDTRSAMCRKCQMVYNHPREGTGKGWYIGESGYVWRFVKCKPYFQHRVVMEEHIGRKLDCKEHIHHKDNDKTNNNIDNLMIVTASEHTTIHWNERKENSANK